MQEFLAKPQSNTIDDHTHNEEFIDQQAPAPQSYEFKQTPKKLDHESTLTPEQFENFVKALHNPSESEDVQSFSVHGEKIREQALGHSGGPLYSPPSLHCDPMPVTQQSQSASPRYYEQ